MSKMAKTRLRVFAFGVAVAALLSVPLSAVFVENTSSQDLARIDSVLSRYQQQIDSQVSQELQTALLVSQLAGEQFSITFKTLDDELVEVGNPVIPFTDLPSESELLAARTAAVTVKFESEEQMRIRTVELADNEFIIVGSSLAEHIRLVQSAQLIQLVAIVISLLLGGISAWFLSRFQQSRLNLELVQRELEFERRSQESMTTFLGDVAHELKTPLTVIRGYSEILDSGADSNQKAVQRITSEVLRMERLLGELLTMAQFRELLAQAPREVALAELIETQVEDLKVLQRSREVSLNIEVRPKLFAPQLSVEMLLSNIFSNIRKHTPSDAPVAVNLQRVSGETVLTIEDGGRGLLPELIEDALVATDRFTTKRNKEVEGQGLGLAIIRDVVNQLGGQLTFSDSALLGGLKIEIRFRN